MKTRQPSLLRRDGGLIQRNRRRGAGGFSLVELMVAVTIGLIIIVGLTAMYVASSSGKKTDARYAEFQTNARYAIDMIRRDIQQAGFAGITVSPSLVNQSVSGAVTINRNCGTNFSYQFDQPIAGYNNANSLGCIAGGDYQPNSDMIVLRRAGPECVVASTFSAATPCLKQNSDSANKLYVSSLFASGSLFLGTTPVTTTYGPVPPEYYELHTDVYFVAPCTSATDPPACTGAGVPALYRKSLVSGPAMSDSLVASNIEDMQLQYGVVNNARAVRYFNADSVPSGAVVSSIRVSLLARSTDRDPGFNTTQTFTYGDRVNVSFSDGYQRQLFQQVIQVRETKDGVVISG